MKKEMNFVEAIIFMKETGKECVNSCYPQLKYKYKEGTMHLIDEWGCSQVPTLYKQELEAIWTVYEPEKPKTKWFKYTAFYIAKNTDLKNTFFRDLIITTETWEKIKKEVSSLELISTQEIEIETDETDIKKIWKLFENLKEN